MIYVKNKQKIDESDWHLHFVWMPVVVEVYPDGNERKVCLTTVLRRKTVDPVALRRGFLVYITEYKERPEVVIPWNDKSRLPDCERKRPFAGTMITIPEDEQDVFPIPFRTDSLTISGEAPEFAPEPKVVFTFNDCKEIVVPEIVGLHDEPKVGLFDIEKCDDCSLKKSDEWHKKLVQAAQDVVDEAEPHPCSTCTETEAEECYECMEIDEDTELLVFTSLSDKEKEGRGTEITTLFGECSKCKSPLTNGGDCTGVGCPLSKPPWVNPREGKDALYECAGCEGVFKWSEMDDGACDCGAYWRAARPFGERPVSMGDAMAKALDHVYPERKEPSLSKPEAMKEAFRVTMTPERKQEPDQRHDIDTAWEVKNARRNKTIM